MFRCRAVVVVLVLVGLGAPRLMAAPTPLQSALDLYAAANYEDALAALDAVSPGGLTVDEHVLVTQHRMLCLMAMGRTADAERAAASLLALRPEFLLAAHDASPRVRTMFDTTRRRVLPAVVRDHFASARKLYDSGALAEARAAFASVSHALADSALVDGDPALGDLRTLAEGFLALTTAAAAPKVELATPPDVQPAPAGAAVPLEGSSASLVAFPRDSSVAWREGESPADRIEHAAVDSLVPASVEAAVPETLVAAPATPVVTSEPPAIVEAPAAAPAPAPAAVTPTVAAAGAPFAPIDIFTYDWRDKDVTPPVPVAQAVSGWWGSMGEPPAGTPLGAVELVIDEHGKVADARIYLSVNRVYDAVLLASVGQWRYTPATRGGRPVKYRRISGMVSGR